MCSSHFPQQSSSDQKQRNHLWVPECLTADRRSWAFVPRSETKYWMKKNAGMREVREKWEVRDSLEHGAPFIVGLYVPGHPPTSWLGLLEVSRPQGNAWKMEWTHCLKVLDSQLQKPTRILGIRPAPNCERQTTAAFYFCFFLILLFQSVDAANWMPVWYLGGEKQGTSNRFWLPWLPGASGSAQVTV